MAYFGTAPRLDDLDVYFVCEIIREAGKLAAAMRSNVKVSQKTAPRDFVTDADLAISTLLVGKLKARFPGDAIVSEEEPNAVANNDARRVWFIDPIDGTENYIANDGMYSVMIGLVIDGQPVYGWVFNPVADKLYVAQPDQQVVRISGQQMIELPHVCLSLRPERVRLMMGNTDREKCPWADSLKGVEHTYNGSVGLRVARILEGGADVYVHLAGKLKEWDTAAPAAMAFASGLEIGSFDAEGIKYGDKNHRHGHAIVFGRPGSLEWARANLQGPPVAEPLVVAPPVSTMVVLP